VVRVATVRGADLAVFCGRVKTIPLRPRNAMAPRAAATLAGIRDVLGVTVRFRMATPLGREPTVRTGPNVPLALATLGETGARTRARLSAAGRTLAVNAREGVKAVRFGRTVTGPLNACRLATACDRAWKMPEALRLITSKRPVPAKP